jgi:hypothetical protein
VDADEPPGLADAAAVLQMREHRSGLVGDGLLWLTGREGEPFSQ